MAKANKIDQIPTRLWEGVEPGTRAGRFVATATCHKCRYCEEWTAQAMPTPTIVVGKFKTKGWTFRHGRPTCAGCQNVRKERNPMSHPEPQPRPVLKVAGGVDKPTPSDAARMQRRLAFIAIEEAYDDRALRYKPGHSDATIAATIGCAEGLVATVRSENFGPAAPPEPPEVARLRQEISALAASAAATAIEAETLKASATSLDLTAREHKRLAVSLGERLERLCRELNWPA